MLLKRRVLFLQESKLNSLQDTLTKSQRKEVFAKIEEMVEREELVTIFGVEAMYDYCAKNLEDPEKDLEILANEMKNYII